MINCSMFQTRVIVVNKQKPQKIWLNNLHVVQPDVKKEENK